MSEALTREAAITAQAVADLMIRAATFGQPREKALRALAKLERCADRAAANARDFSNVYPLRGPHPTPRAVDDAREARRQVAELLAQAVRDERFSLRVGKS